MSTVWMDVPDGADAAGYQGRGQSWRPQRQDVGALLKDSRHVETQPIYHGSNHTFLVKLEHESAGPSLAVYKPARGEYPLYDFASGTLYRREVATSVLDQLAGWHLVPPTVVGRGKYGVGSVQLLIEAQSTGDVSADDVRRLALLDVLLNNADRKAEHLLVGEENRLWGIDHGLTFHVQPKLRTVLWHFAGSKLVPREQQDLENLLDVLNARSADQVDLLTDLLTSAEFRALRRRLETLVRAGAFPDPVHKAVPYRW